MTLNLKTPSIKKKFLIFFLSWTLSWVCVVSWITIHIYLLQARYEYLLYKKINFWVFLFEFDAWTTHLLLTLLYAVWFMVMLVNFCYFFKEIVFGTKLNLAIYFLGGVLSSMLATFYYSSRSFAFLTALLSQ